MCAAPAIAPGRHMHENHLWCLRLKDRILGFHGGHLPNRGRLGLRFAPNETVAGRISRSVVPVTAPPPTATIAL